MQVKILRAREMMAKQKYVECLISTPVNCTFSNLAELWWAPNFGGKDRVHRVGQTVYVNLIKYSCAGTIEERIDRILERKRRLFDQLG